MRARSRLLPALSRSFSSLTNSVRTNGHRFYQNSSRTNNAFLFALATASALYYFSKERRTVELVAEEKDTKLKELKSIESKAPIFRIVITGGPCAGKSSAMTKLS